MLTVHEATEVVLVCIDLPPLGWVIASSFYLDAETCLFDLARLLPLFAPGVTFSVYANGLHPLNGPGPIGLRWNGRVPGKLPRLVPTPSPGARELYQVLA